MADQRLIVRNKQLNTNKGGIYDKISLSFNPGVFLRIIYHTEILNYDKQRWEHVVIWQFEKCSLRGSRTSAVITNILRFYFSLVTISLQFIASEVVCYHLGQIKYIPCFPLRAKNFWWVAREGKFSILLNFFYFPNMNSLEGAWISITSDFGWISITAYKWEKYGFPLLWFTMMDIHPKLPVMDIHVPSRLMNTGFVPLTSPKNPHWDPSNKECIESGLRYKVDQKWKAIKCTAMYFYYTQCTPVMSYSITRWQAPTVHNNISSKLFYFSLMITFHFFFTGDVLKCWCLCLRRTTPC